MSGSGGRVSSRNEITHLFEGRLTILACVNHIRRRLVDSFRPLTGATARALGYGGVKAVAEASGVSLKTVQNGARDVDKGVEPSVRVRTPGGTETSGVSAVRLGGGVG